MGKEWVMKEPEMCIQKFKFTIAEEKNYKITCVHKPRLQNMKQELKKEFLLQLLPLSILHHNNNQKNNVSAHEAETCGSHGSKIAVLCGTYRCVVL